MLLTIQEILADFTLVLAAVVGVIGDIATWMITNPLFLIAIGMTLFGLAVAVVRRFVRN